MGANPIKGYAFVAYIKFALAREMKDLIGCRMDYIDGKATWVDKCREATDSLNRRIDTDDEDGKELHDLVVDEIAGRFPEECEKDEIRAIVTAAVNRLPRRECYVITEVYFNEKQKKDLVDGVQFESRHLVDNTEYSALFKLRKDKSLRTIYYECYREPYTLSPLRHTPEKVVIANEAADEWLQHITQITQNQFVYKSMNEWIEIIKREKERFHAGLQAVS